MKRKSFWTILIIAVLITAIILLLKSINPSKVSSANYYSYKLKEKILINQNVKLTTKSQLIIDGENNQFIIRVLPSKVFIIDVKKDSIIRTFAMKKMKIKSFDAPDTNNFVILTDSCFLVYKNKEFKEIKFSVFNDNFIPVRHSRIVYCPDYNEIYSIAVPTNFDRKNNRRYNHNFINTYNIESLSSKVIEFKYPEKYQLKNLGIPRPYLTRSDSLLIVSFEFDENIHIYNLEKRDGMNSINLVSVNSKLNKEIPKGLNRAEKIDAVINLSRYNDGFGPAFYDKINKQFLRIYRPNLPEKNSNDEFYSSSDVGCNLLILKDRKVKEYQFSNGTYFVYRHFKFNPNTSSLTYLKIYNPNEDRKTWKYSIHSIFPFNF